MQPLRNVLKQNAAVTLGASVSDDLPVNPIYCILYTLRAEQLAVSDTADKIPGLADILSDVSRIEVLFRGTTVVSGSLTDIMMMNATLTGKAPFIIHGGDATNNAVALTVPIYLGRPSKAGMEAFPATRRGELTLRREFSSSSPRQVTTTITEQIETIELLGADPASFLKYITIAKTFVTTGDNDVDLPLGNPILQTLLFGTTGFTATTSVATWKQTKVLVDNVEWDTALANWETLNGELNYCVPFSQFMQDHTHTENLAAAYAADVATAKVRGTDSITDNYALLNFDRWRDGNYALETAGRGRVHLRATAGTADAARALPLEVINIGASTAQA